MENLCQRVSVTNSVHLTAKINAIVCPIYTSVDRGSSEFNLFMMTFAMVARNFAVNIYFSQNLRRRRVAILTRGLTTVKCGHHSRHS